MLPKKKRTLKKNTELYNYYYKKSGFYKTLLKSVLKLSITVVVVIALFIFVTNYLIDDLEGSFIALVESVPHWSVYVMFFFTDSILLSIVPPDLFILWADSFQLKFLVLFFLGAVSYGAGIFAYFIGTRIADIPVVNSWLNRKFNHLTRSVNKWGGAFIIVAAVLPIPWGPALIVSGMMKYSFRYLLLFSLARFARFFLYGLILFNVVDVF
jgi:membrane protein YqaA with SNARE-associated domain